MNAVYFNRDQQIWRKSRAWLFSVEQSVAPFKVDSSILQSNGGALGSTGLVISPLVQSGWLDQCNAAQQRSAPFVLWRPITGIVGGPRPLPIKGRIARDPRIKGG